MLQASAVLALLLSGLTQSDGFSPQARVSLPTGCDKRDRANSRKLLKYAKDRSPEDHGVELGPSLPKQLRFLDLNGDGKLDQRDLEVLNRRLLSLLDLNGDGEINEEDALIAFRVVLISTFLLASPANAKGGGSGGGGYSGGHSSSPSYRSYKKKRFSENNYSLDPNACSNMPGDGELLDVLVDQRKGKYVTGVVESIDQSDCSFVVDLPPTADQAPSSKTLTTNKNWVWEVQIAALSLFFLSLLFITDDIAEFDARFSESQTDLVTGACPPSGNYRGKTIESDGITQKIKCTINFKHNGKIYGEGKDSVDGTYSIAGEWVGNMVKWRESYFGFSVTVRGWVHPGGTLQCFFVSSRGVRGSFNLRIKPME